jgi:hypothetical protein
VGFSALGSLKGDILQQESDHLEKDYGLSAGVSVSNSEFNLEDNGFSTRMRVNMDVLNNGWMSNKMEAKRKALQKELMTIHGDIETLNHNFGIYADYLVYLFNKEKEPIITELLDVTNELEYNYTNLYYNKLATFEDVIDARSKINRYQSLLIAVHSYNDIVSELILSHPLPFIEDDLNHIYDIRIEDIKEAIAQDSIQSIKTQLHKAVVMNKYKKNNLPRLQFSTGYRVRDIGLTSGKMFFALSFTKDLSPNKEKVQDMELQLIEYRNEIETYQKSKELVNLYYDYQYKMKQYKTQQYKKYHFDERSRVNRVKNEILDIASGVESLNVTADSLMVELEIVESRQQMFIKLLQLKKLIHPLKLGDFLNRIPILDDAPRYAGNRFYLIKEGYELTAHDLNILENNEVQVITTDDILKMRQIVLVPVQEFDNRAALEEWISIKIDKNPQHNFLFTNLEAFKDLEIRTMDNPHLTFNHR